MSRIRYFPFSIVTPETVEEVAEVLGKDSMEAKILQLYRLYKSKGENCVIIFQRGQLLLIDKKFIIDYERSDEGTIKRVIF